MEKTTLSEEAVMDVPGALGLFVFLFSACVSK